MDTRYEGGWRIERLRQGMPWGKLCRWVMRVPLGDIRRMVVTWRTDDEGNPQDDAVLMHPEAARCMLAICGEYLWGRKPPFTDEGRDEWVRMVMEKLQQKPPARAGD